ncbi:hypothetical protein F5H01DRAFT_382435 [Linnemannia elongata]|nr:hypothetical protein F5H01DRAFT_382435 [Linnemannia elongata]
MIDIAINSKPTAVSMVVSTPELVDLIIAHSAKRSLYKLRLVSRLFAQACHPYFSIPLLHPKNCAPLWGRTSLSHTPGHIVQSIQVAQHDAKDCSIIQSTFTALEHLDIYVTNSPSSKSHTAATSHMNLDPLFRIGSALEHRFNHLTITVMGDDEHQEQDPWFLTEDHEEWDAWFMTEDHEEWNPWFLTGTHREPDSSERTIFSQVTSLHVRPTTNMGGLWVQWSTIAKLARDIFPSLERLTLSRIMSSEETMYDDIPELEGGGFAIDVVTSTRLTHLDLANMCLSLRVICRLNRCFPNLERLAVRGWNIAKPVSVQENPDFVATPLSVKSFAIHAGNVDDVLALLPLLDKVVDLAMLDLNRGSPTDLVDGFSKISGRNRFKQFTFTELKHKIMKQKDMAALLRVDCLQGLECLTLKCHPAWVSQDFTTGNVSPRPFTFLSTLERLELLKPDFCELMSEEMTIKFNAMLKSMPHLKHLVVRTPLFGFKAFEGLGRVETETGVPCFTDEWDPSSAWSHCLQKESTGPWLETIEVFWDYRDEGLEEFKKSILNRFSPWLEKLTISMHSEETRGSPHKGPLKRLQEWGDTTTKERLASDGVQISVVFRTV